MSPTLLHRSLTLALAAAFGTLAFVPAPAQAQRAAAAKPLGAPGKLVLDNSSRVIGTLDTRRAEFTRDRAALRKFVSGEFSQMFDRDYAARQVLGRHARGVADADIQAFGDALADNLMQRYGSSLLAFNTRLKVRVKSETPLPRGLGVKVASELLRSGGDPIPVDYLMRQVGGTWRVFDVQVEGVSFVQTFRSQFDAELQRKTLAQVTQALRNGQLRADAGR